MTSAGQQTQITPTTDLSHPELVVGIVAAVGTPIELAVRLVRQALEGLDYIPETLHLSQYTNRFQLENSKPLASATIAKRIAAMMARGTEAREVTRCDEILALAAVGDLRVKGGPGGEARQRTAYVLRQLKHPEEIHLLRRTYGDGFFAVGFYAPRSERERYLRAKGATPLEIDELIAKDDYEGVESGQRFRDTFHLADAFVRIGSDEESCARELRRLFSLVFGTEIVTPRREEFGMFQAFGAALRSSQMGRQVGAAILSDLGDVISVGTNEVPCARGGSYWEGIDPDHRDHQRGFDSNDDMKSRLVDEVVDRFTQAKLLRATVADDGVRGAARTALANSRVNALIEFGRAIHAEADAIVSASRLGRSTRGADLFCTTFPCHLCAKQIVAAGIRSVTFIEPYPKSLAEQLHGDAIALEEPTTGKVVFEPFVGVAPRRYVLLFSAFDRTGRPIERKDGDGSIRRDLFHPRLRMAYFSSLDREKREAERLEQITEEAEP